MMIDAMAERYGMLPSDVLHKGNTMDLLIFDASMSYRQHIQAKANGEPAVKTDDFTQDELKEMMEKRRGKSVHT